MKRSYIIFVLLLLICSFVASGFIWRMKQHISPAEMSVDLMPGSVANESVRLPDLSGEENLDAGSDAEAIKEIMAEIEKTAAGDEGVLESEYAAESESFIDSTVVIEQLGTSYDETSY